MDVVDGRASQLDGAPSARQGAKGDLPAHEFAAAVAAVPLVSIDWVLTDPDGRLLLGQRIRKNEPIQQAMARIARDELGLAPQQIERAMLMGVWDHFYPDSAFDDAVSTHYVNLPHWLALSWPEVERLALRPNAQHSAWQWFDAGQAQVDEGVHPYVRAYAGWVRGR